MSVRHEIPLENEQFTQTGREYKSLSGGTKVNVRKWRSDKEGENKTFQTENKISNMVCNSKYKLPYITLVQCVKERYLFHSLSKPFERQALG